MAEYTGPLEQVGPYRWRIPKSYRDDMRVDGIIFADENLIDQIKKDQGPEQVTNVATLPVSCSFRPTASISLSENAFSCRSRRS